MSTKPSWASLKKRLQHLFQQSLKAFVPTLDNLHPLIAECHFVSADYQCNVLILFHKIKKIRPEFSTPMMLAQAIKENMPKSEMIESCFVESAWVFVVVSRKWLAMNIEKMLIEGIESWAPRLPITRAAIHFMEPYDGDIMHGGHFRSTIIGDSLTKILEFCGVEVLKGGRVDDSNKLVTHSKVEDTPLGYRDHGLEVLGHYLEEGADWIIIVAHNDLREHIRDFFDYSKQVGLHFGEDGAYPKVTHVEYTLSTRDEGERLQDSLIHLFVEAKKQAMKALEEQGKDEGWFSEELDKNAELVGQVAERYFDLEWNRHCNYVFTSDEMVKLKDNVCGFVVAVLRKYSWLCTTIRELGIEDMKQLVNKDTEQLKKSEVLGLDREYDRQLGVHLLQFSEIVEDACSGLCPDII